MKFDFSRLDHSIAEELAKSPLRLDEIVEMELIRRESLRLNIRRAGTSPSASADTTVNERLQALRRNGTITYDPATGRWVRTNDPSNLPFQRTPSARLT